MQNLGSIYRSGACNLVIYCCDRTPVGADHTTESVSIPIPEGMLSSISRDHGTFASIFLLSRTKPEGAQLRRQDFSTVRFYLVGHSFLQVVGSVLIRPND